MAFFPKMSIFTHFFLIYAHAYAKKAVILHRELVSGLAPVRNTKI